MIELLVVVAIIGVLAAVAIPAYQNYQADAALNSATLSAKTIYKAIAVCLANGDGVLCTNATVNSTLDRTCNITGTNAALTDDTCQIGVTGTTFDTYCVAVKAKASIYCVDSSGSSGVDKQICVRATGACT